MSQSIPTKCLFIGGSADGRRLEVDPQAAEHRVSSVANVPDPTHGMATGDPRPAHVPVVEVYHVITVHKDEGSEIAFALNALTPDAIQPQVVKHFGRGATYSRGR